MPRRLLTHWRRTCNRSPLAGSSREYPNTIPTPPTILSRRSAPASGASALIRESERMHTPGQFGPPAISAFAPLCTKRERSVRCAPVTRHPYFAAIHCTAACSVIPLSASSGRRRLINNQENQVLAHNRAKAAHRARHLSCALLSP